MRCNKCNVDLGEEYTKCPLCGATASPDEPKLKGIKTAEYPKYDKSLSNEKIEYHTTFPQKYVYRICAGLCITVSLFSAIAFKFLWANGYFPYNFIWSYGVPTVMTISSLFYFFYAFKEKGRLLHSALSLIATTATLLIFGIIAFISHTGVQTMLIALAVSIVLFVILLICKPERVKEQLKATFKL